MRGAQPCLPSPLRLKKRRVGETRKKERKRESGAGGLVNLFGLTGAQPGIFQKPEGKEEGKSGGGAANLHPSAPSAFKGRAV